MPDTQGATRALPVQRPVKRSKCRQLFRSPSMPSSVIRPILKRIDRPQDRDTPIKTKRRRSVAGTPSEEVAAEPVGDGETWGRGILATVQSVPGGTAPCPGSAGALANAGGGCLWFASPQKARLLRSRSFCYEEIENLLANDHRELIGDFSKVGPRGCCRPGGAAPLPLQQRHHQRSPAPVREPKPSWWPLPGDKGTWGCDFFQPP